MNVQFSDSHKSTYLASVGFRNDAIAGKVAEGWPVGPCASAKYPWPRSLWTYRQPPAAIRCESAKHRHDHTAVLPTRRAADAAKAQPCPDL